MNSFAAPAEEELADTITIGEYLIGNKDASFMLEMQGDSMAGEGILHGDRVIFERMKDHKPGDIVVALTEDGYVLSKYPEVRAAEAQIIGVVTSSFRKYR